MIHISVLREQKDEIVKRLSLRIEDSKKIISEILKYDDQRKKNQGELDELLFKGKSLTKKIGQLYKSGNLEEANKLKDQSIKIRQFAKDLQQKNEYLEKSVKDLLIKLPNIPHKSVPKGFSSKDNILIKSVGEPPSLSENAKPHWELAEEFSLINFELGNKITGAGFPVYLDKGAKLRRALISFFLDKNINAGYKELTPPYLVNEASAYSTGQLPDKDGQMYHVELDNLYLIPTAEVPTTNAYRNKIIETNKLPIKLTSYTPCFRREAGSYGKDVRGLNRLHQFDKVEIVQIENPKKSYDTLELMVKHVSKILKDLELPFRVLKLCVGDLGFTSALTYDFEVYSAAQKKWLEVSSVSNFESYQANRLKLRFRDENGKISLCHTLNGSALALPRIIASILENNQTSNGILIPKALVPYTGFEIIK